MFSVTMYLCSCRPTPFDGDFNERAHLPALKARPALPQRTSPQTSLSREPSSKTRLLPPPPRYKPPATAPTGVTHKSPRRIAPLSSASRSRMRDDAVPLLRAKTAGDVRVPRGSLLDVRETMKRKEVCCLEDTGQFFICLKLL